MPKNIENEQTNLFNDLPVKNPNKKGGNMGEEKIVSKMDIIVSRLIIEYASQQRDEPTAVTEGGRIIERRQREQRIEKLKQRLLETLGGDKGKFEQKLKDIQKKAEEIINHTPSDPYKDFNFGETPTQTIEQTTAVGAIEKSRVNKKQRPLRRKGPPFCEKCQHFHWPQEPHTDWQD